jgi:hypothetical protein
MCNAAESPLVGEADFPHRRSAFAPGPQGVARVVVRKGDLLRLALGDRVDAVAVEIELAHVHRRTACARRLFACEARTLNGKFLRSTPSRGVPHGDLPYTRLGRAFVAAYLDDVVEERFVLLFAEDAQGLIGGACPGSFGGQQEGECKESESHGKE